MWTNVTLDCLTISYRCIVQFVWMCVYVCVCEWVWVLSQNMATKSVMNATQHLHKSSSIISLRCDKIYSIVDMRSPILYWDFVNECREYSAQPVALGMLAFSLSLYLHFQFSFAVQNVDLIALKLVLYAIQKLNAPNGDTVRINK